MELDQKSPKTTLFLLFLLSNLHEIDKVQRKTAKVRKYHRKCYKIVLRLTTGMTSLTDTRRSTNKHPSKTPSHSTNTIHDFSHADWFNKLTLWVQCFYNNRNASINVKSNRHNDIGILAQFLFAIAAGNAK